jgi:hypothetical protein
MTIGNGLRRLHGRNRVWIGSGNDDVHAEPDQVCGKRGQPFHLAVGEAVLNDDILANPVTQAPQALFKRFDEMELLLPRGDREVAHPVDSPCRLLRTRGQRPRRCRAT